MPGRIFLLLLAAALLGYSAVDGINVGVSGQAGVLDRLSAMDSGALYRLFGNHSVTFKAVTVPSGWTSTEINAFVSSTKAESFDLVIGTFNELLASVCSYLSLPFYSLSEKLLSPDATSPGYLSGSSTLVMNTLLEELVLATVNFTNTVAKRSTIVMLTDEIGARLNVLLDRNISMELQISAVNTSTSSYVRQLLFNSTLYASVDSTVYMVVSSNPDFVSTILNEAVFLSMLKSTSYWIIADFFLDKAIVTQYFSTGAKIITFRLPNVDISNQTQLEFSMATDAILHYIASSAYNATNTTSIMQKIFFTTIDGSVSKLHFNSDSHQLDLFAVNLMSVDGKSGTDLVLYAIWNESVSNSISVSRTKASVQLPNLRIAGALVEPYIMTLPSGYTGYSINVLDKISANLFTYDLNDLSKNTSANYLQAVQLGQADMAISLVELTAAILNDSRIVFSDIPLLTSGVAALGRSAIKEIDFLSPLYPLTWNVWFAIILAFLILSATLYLTDKISPNDYKRPKFSVFSAAFFVYSSFVMSKLKSSAVKPSSHIFILILWFASLMYCTTYGTNYFFLLIRSNTDLPFNSLSGLYSMSSSYYWMMVKDSPEYRLMAAQNSTGNVYKKIIDTPPSFLPTSVTDAVRIIMNSTLPGQKKPIFIGDELTVKYYAADDCSLTSAGKNELSRDLHMIFSASLSKTLLSDINNRIQELSDTGQLERIKNNYWSVLVCSASQNLITYSDLKQVTIDQVAGIFIVLAAAFVLSFLVVALEYIGHMIGLQIQRTKADPKLQFNRTYQVEVTNITQEGVYVKLHGEKEFIPNAMLSPDATASLGASDLQICRGNMIYVKYLGNDPVQGFRMFQRTTH